MSDSQLELMSYSAVIPVGPRADDLEVLVREYNSAFESMGNPYEIIVVLDAQGSAMA